MYHKYFQFTTKFIKTWNHMGNSTLLSGNWENHLPKRWAGHSKWQNIKHTKQAADHSRSVAFQKLARVITLTVRQSGQDPSTNSKLKSLLEEAQKMNMPKSTLEKILKAAQAQTSERPYWTVFSGPKGIVLGLEVVFANNKPSFLVTKLGSQTKKLKLKIEPHFSHLCTERGLIVTEGLKSAKDPYEKAVEDAIEIGIDEVHENSDKSLIFECSPDRIDSYSQQLLKKGYNVESLSTELDFNEFVQLEEDEINDLERIITNLQNQYEEVIRGSYNRLPE